MDHYVVDHTLIAQQTQRSIRPANLQDENLPGEAVAKRPENTLKPLLHKAFGVVLSMRSCRTGRPKWFSGVKFLQASAGLSAVAFGLSAGVGPAGGRIVEAPAERGNSDTYTVLLPYKSMA